MKILFILISKLKSTCLPITAVRLRQISGSLCIDYSDSQFNIRASSPGPGYILIYVGQSYSSVGHLSTSKVGQTINLSFTNRSDIMSGSFLSTSDNFTNRTDNVRDRPIF